MNNTQFGGAYDIVVVIEYSDIYLETSGSLWQNYGDEPALIFLLITMIVFCSNLNEK